MYIILILVTFILGCRGNLFIERIIESKCPHLEPGNCPLGNEITYWLATSSSKGYQVKLDLVNLKQAPVIKGPLIVWIHGYTDNRESQLTKQVVNGYISHGQYNVLVVDWNTYCRLGCYMHATQTVWSVGVCAAQFVLELLRAHHVDYYHLMGHSLGAHVAAWASVYMPGLPRLTKFDPAMPLFTEKDTQRGSAKFIDVYHSNCDVAGQRHATGDVDVYFNRETFQPGCKCNLVCSHTRCVIYFLESIGKTMMAFPCPGWNAYNSNKCPVPRPADLVRVGEGIDPRTRGVFMVFTKDKAPFLENSDVYTRPDAFESFKRSPPECPITKYERLVKNWIEGK